MLIAENITKKFSGVTALDNVCLKLLPGQVNAIIGENGAGKSTLMKILSGVYTDYEGSIVYKNKTVRFGNTRQAQQAGIAIIHQELNLIPYLSITENLFLGRELTTPLGLLDKKEMRRQAAGVLKKLKLFIDPGTQVGVLKVGQQQVIEIAKALLFEAEVIIMDEPTSAISQGEVEVLFGIIDQLRQEQKTIVYISHKLDELFRIADRYIVLRDGKTIESGPMEGMTHDKIIQKMVGREIRVVAGQKEKKNAGSPLMEVKGLSVKHPVRKNDYLLKNVSFTLHQGEILGIFGLMGAGRTELLEALFGLSHRSTSSDSLIIGGEEANIQSPADAISCGLALVPEDRKKDGLVLGLDVRTNICITALDQLEDFGLLNAGKEAALAKSYVSSLAIKTASDQQATANLSGGNQQKIVLAKWLATQPRVLMLDEPTRGIDVNAKNEIYKLILQLAGEGLGIIMVSSELPEILAVSDRVLVMAEGALTAEFPVSEATEDNILKAAIPKTT